MVGWQILIIAFKTTNGGSSWTTFQTNSMEQWYSVYFTDIQNGWATGGLNGIYGIILKTTDGGLNWISQGNKNNIWLWSIHFTNNQSGWAVGANGTILHTSTGGVTPTHKTIVSSPTFSLYPNPAEENFSLAGKGEVLQVSLVDAMGKEIQVPESVELSGSDPKIDIRSLKPGLYWVKIKTSTGVAVERLVKR